MENIYELLNINPETEDDVIHCFIKPIDSAICDNIEIDGSLFANTLPHSIAVFLSDSRYASRFKVSLA